MRITDIIDLDNERQDIINEFDNILNKLRIDDIDSFNNIIMNKVGKDIKLRDLFARDFKDANNLINEFGYYELDAKLIGELFRNARKIYAKKEEELKADTIDEFRGYGLKDVEDERKYMDSKDISLIYAKKESHIVKIALNKVIKEKRKQLRNKP